MKKQKSSKIGKKEFVKPSKLQSGDTVALITLSWGGASAHPDRYLAGKKQLKEAFGLNVIDTPNATKSSDWIYANPKARLEDLVWAFKNSEVKAAISIIGGDDSIRMLNHLTEEELVILRDNPTIFLGLSDTTVANFILMKAGVTSFYGPSVLFGIAESGGMHPYTIKGMKKALFSAEPIGNITNRDQWTLDRVPWEKQYQNQKRRTQKPIHMKCIQGKGSASGHIIGGCMDVLEFIKGTSLWPSSDMWDGAILLLETSEENPSPDQVMYWLRNYGSQGILQKLNGIVFGVPGIDIAHDHSDYKNVLEAYLGRLSEYDAVFRKVCAEFDREDLIIISHAPIGHTMPVCTLPLMTQAVLTADEPLITIIENGVI